MPAAWAGVAVAAGSAIAGAAGGSGASGAISDGQAQANAAAQQAIAEGRVNYQQDRSTYQPFVNQGTAGLNQYANLLGVNGQDAANTAMGSFQASPGYQYQVDQGMRAVDNGAAAKGMFRSGATLKAEQTLGSNLANQDFSSYMGRLNTLAGFGMQGAQGQANATGMFNNLMSGQSSNIQSTDTSAAGQQASIYANTANQLGSAAQGAVGLAQKNGLLDFGSSGVSGSAGNGFGGSYLNTGMGY